MKPNARPRRILMTTDAVGGVWHYAATLARELAAAGDTVMLAGVGPRPSRDQCREAAAFAIIEWVDSPPEWLASDEADVADLGGRLAALAGRHRADLVQVNAPSQAVGLDVSCPVVAVSHSCAPTWFQAVRGGDVPPDWAWQKERNRRGFARADIAVAPSRSHAAALSALYGDLPRLHVVHNAAPLGSRAHGREDFVLAAGRWWDEGKNAGALDAAAVRSRWPIFAAGSATGPNGTRHDFSEAVGLGPLRNEDLRWLMARCGVFVSPSIYEPFGLAPLEAAGSGAPLVLADIPTYRELWEGAALFFPPDDAAILGETLNWLAGDRDARDALADAAFERAQRFTVAGQAAAMRALYDRAAFSIQPALSFAE